MTSSRGASMFGLRRALLTAASTGRHLIGWSCPFAGSQWRAVHCSHSLGRQDPTEELTLLEKNVPGTIDDVYPPQQKDGILHLVNTASQSQLDCVMEGQGKEAAAIVQYREQYGPFRDINTLCQVQHVNPAIIHKVCDSMFSFSDRTDRKVFAKFLKPNIPIYRLQAAESIVSIVFGMRKLAWAHMDCTMTVRDWQQRECFQFEKSKHLPEIYLENLLPVVSQLPQADFYILEKLSFPNKNKLLLPVMLHFHTVEAMLYGLLNRQFTEEQEHRVFSMQRNTVGKHFDIMLKGSRTSGVDVVQRLIDKAIIAPQPRVNFPSELVHQYRQQSQARGQTRNEELCDALLQAVTVYELTQLYSS